MCVREREREKVRSIEREVTYIEAALQAYNLMGGGGSKEEEGVGGGGGWIFIWFKYHRGRRREGSEL